MAAAGGMKQLGPRRHGRPALFVPRGEVIPIAYAVSAKLRTPTSSASCAYTTSIEFQVACVSDIVPLPGSALWTGQGKPPGIVSVIGEVPSRYVVAGSMPCLIAVVSTNV